MGRGDLAGAAHLELVSGCAAAASGGRDVRGDAAGLAGPADGAGAAGGHDRVPRERLVRRFVEFTNEYPWNWTPAHVDEWTLSLTGEKRLAPSTIRGYQTRSSAVQRVRVDARYGWVPACEEAFGPGFSGGDLPRVEHASPHLNDYEGNPEARPFTREELQRFLDYADDQVERAVRAKRKGALAAYRDATLFKVVYAWGLRRTETSKLDVVDLGTQPGGAGVRPVRHAARPLRQGEAGSAAAAAERAVGDGLGGRGGRRLRRQHPAAVRLPTHPALWVTERGGRLHPAEINDRFVAYRDALGLPRSSRPTSLRHSYVICTANERVRDVSSAA